MPFQQGQMLNDRYRIVKLLGQGGFGAVYRAWDTNLSRPCAVKENLDTSPEAHRQFSREATVLANLSHPNLPRVTDHFSLPGQGQYLVMDFVDGEDLATKLERSGPLPIEQALHWVMQVADALTYMHSRVPSVLHRDIKPANIRITPAGEATPFGKAMLVDFGLVKIGAPHLKTTVGARAVTPGYAPPEQYGQGSTDQRTDLYALGATLYSLLTNQRPLDGLQRMMGKRMQTVVELNPQIPEQLSKVIERVMSLDAKQRYQNADDFKAALSISIPTLPGSGVSLLGDDLFFSDATRVSSIPATQVYPAPQVSPKAEAYPVVQPPAGAGSEDRYRNVTPQQYTPGRSSDPQPQRPLHPQSPPVASPAYPRQAWADNTRLDRTAAKRSRSPLVWIALAVVALLCLGALAVAYSFLQTTDGGISEEDFQATVDERVLLTSTAQAEGTSAVETEVSGDGTPETGAESSEEVRKQLIDAALANRSLVLGPSQGSLAHDPKTQLIAGQTLGVNVQYFILEVRFYNPYAASRSSWDYGLLFRHMGSNQHFRLIIRSDKTMVLMNNVGQPNGEILFQGNIPGLNIDEGGWNLLTLYCLKTPEGYPPGDRGLIYINKTFIAEIDLSMRSNSGDIAIVTGTYEGDQVEGESTDYQDLNLWSVP